jgi:hypothetical protein
MTVVFACADPQVPGGLILPSARKDLLGLLEGMSPGALVCTTASTGPAAAHLRRYLRAGIRPDVRMVHLPLSPTMIPVLASVLRAGGFPPGAVLTLTTEVTAVCPTVAVLDSVNQLEAPAPSVLQHALSRFPGVRFGINVRGHGVRGGVVRVNWVPSARDREESAVIVAASADDPTSQRWRRNLERANPARCSLATGAAGQPFRGARRWAEVTAVPCTFDELAQHLRTKVRIVICPWCGNGVSARVCPFCGIIPASSSSAWQPPPAPVPVTARAARPSAWTQMVPQGDRARSIGSVVR